MLPLNQQERNAFLIVIAVIVIGFFVQGVFCLCPRFREAVGFLDQEIFEPPVDINSATFEELVAVPYIGNVMAGKIIDYRVRNSGYSGLEELKNVKGITENKLATIVKYLTVKRSSASFDNKLENSRGPDSNKKYLEKAKEGDVR